MPPPSQHPSAYFLPSSPALLVDDRFSILDVDDAQVPFWTLLSALLKQDIQHSKGLTDLLETISITIHGSSATDYVFLRTFLESETSRDFWTVIWPALKSLALRMPALFPEHSLPILSPAHPRIVLSREQVACLVVHQFLCTLPIRAWEETTAYHDFHLWYGTYQPHAGAAKAYLKALFAYFHRLAHDHEANPMAFSVAEWPIVYAMSIDDAGLDGQAEMISLRTIRLQQASTAPSVLGLPAGGAVISANKCVGFGQTGTQEEVHVGASPEACPAVLVTPPLLNDQVMIVTGAEAMISIEGYGREAHCGEILQPSPDRATHKSLWNRRTMLFMDAAELDLADADLGTPVDLQAGNVLRDLRKAYIAFKYKRRSTLSEECPTIYTGFWGCRTFGGNPEIKACIQWVAASLAGCELRFVCSGAEQHAFADRLDGFVAEIRRRNVHCKEFEDMLLYLKPNDVGPEESPFAVVLGKLIGNSA